MPLAFLAAVALAPTVAQAHAAIVASQPAPGQQLSSGPGVVVLQFTEPMNAKLSRATVTDPVGQRFVGRPSGDREIQVRVPTNAPGVYQVSWTTVGVLDGHTLQGGFQFGVGVAPPGEAEASVLLSVRVSDYPLALGRALEYAGLLTAIGMLLLQFLARREPRLPWVRVSLPLPLGVALLSGIGVTVGEAFTAASALSPTALADYLRNGLPGLARLGRLIAEGYALSFSAIWIRIVPLPVVAAIVFLAAAGHGAAVAPTWWGVGADAVHLLAAGLWAGGILALATLRPPDGWLRGDGRTLMDRFSPIAIPAFLVSVGFGAIRALQEVGDLGSLVASSYGQVLSAKGLLVLGLAALSLLAWRRRLVAPRVEAAVVLAAVGAAALLATHPLPPARVQEVEAAREQTRFASALPEPGDLTLGGDAGEVLVGLTLRPGAPGRNEVLLHLFPAEGEAAARGLSVLLAVNGRPVQTRECGPACRRGETDLEGRERVEVQIGGPSAGTAAFTIPPLPAADGASLVERMRSRMRRLQTVRYDEILRPPVPAVQARYEVQAPDRIRYEIATGSELRWIGDTRYIRDGPNAPWQVEKFSVSLPVPLFVWDPPAVAQPLNPRLLGTEPVEGVDTQIVTFFAQAGSLPVWFRVWIDSDGLARRAQMRAPSHFMDHRYYDFDAPIAIEPPSP